MPGMGELLIISIIGVITLGGFVFWIFTLLECARMEPTTSSERWIWILVIVLAGWLGALVYRLYRKPQRIALFGR